MITNHLVFKYYNMAVLGKIRQNVGLLIFVIAIAMVAFLLMDVSSGGFGQPNQPIAGSVDGISMTQQEYERRVQDAVANAQSRGSNFNDEQRMQLREQVWEQYVQDALAQREYEKLGLAVSDEEARELIINGNHPAVRSTRIFLDDNGVFSPQKVKDYISSFSDENNPNREEMKAQWRLFEQSILKDQARTKYANLFKKAIYVPTPLAERAHIEQNQKANIEYVQVPYETIDDTEISVADADLNAYLKAHPSKYKSEETRSVDYVVFPVRPSAEDSTNLKNYVTNLQKDFAEVDDVATFLKSNSDAPFLDIFQTRDQLRSSKADTLFSTPVGGFVGTYLEAGSWVLAKVLDKKIIADSVRVRQVFQQTGATRAPDVAKKTIDSLYNAIKNGADFEAQASAFSDDNSKEQGGDLGYIQSNSNRYPTEFINAIFYDHTEGDLFPIQTSIGWHLVQIEEAKPSKPAIKVGYLTREITPSEATARLAYSEANSFAGMNRKPDAFKKSATDKGLEIKKMEGLGKNDFQISDLGVSRELSTWAFRSGKGDVSQVFDVENTLPNGSIITNHVVALLTDIQKAGNPLNNPKTRTAVENAVKREKKAEKIVAKIGAAPRSLNAVASASGEEVKSAEGVPFGSGTVIGIGNEPKLQAAAMGLQANQISKPIKGERGVYVVKVISVDTPGIAADLTPARKALSTKLGQGVDGPQINVFRALSKSSDVEDDRFKNRSYNY